MLVAKGWKVIRSAGSHQAIDLVAGRFFGKVNRRLAIQCKTGEARFTEADKIATMAMAHHFDAVPMLAERKNQKRSYRILSDTKDVLVGEAFFDGYSPDNLVCFMHPKQYNDLLNDANIVRYLHERRGGARAR